MINEEMQSSYGDESDDQIKISKKATEEHVYLNHALDGNLEPDFRKNLMSGLKDVSDD